MPKMIYTPEEAGAALLELAKTASGNQDLTSADIVIQRAPQKRGPRAKKAENGGDAAGAHGRRK